MTLKTEIQDTVNGQGWCWESTQFISMTSLCILHMALELDTTLRLHIAATSRSTANGDSVHALSCMLIHGRPSSTREVFVALLSLHFPSS